MTRIAIVEKEKCNPIKCGDLCIKLCPVNRTGKECIRKDEEGKAAIEEDLCTGCGICSNRCPFDAISIINLPEELNNNPIHQYGMNGFHLYNLPVPLFGKVVGLLGRNGIGKSTAVKILSGILKPNLGEDGKEATPKELIDFFKGTEAQLFFEKLSSDKITVSYKPQQVEMIPRFQEGSIRELLKKIDEKDGFDRIVDILELSHILDTDIKDVSGGELQRVAIAAAALKDANVYFFDEPTSYLDIKQRIKVSRFIRELATEDVAVMVVEHDLVILDYMTDNIHIMYGKPGCYGIVSQPKATKSGINTYLSGFLREENIRFRDKPLTFEEKIPTDILKKEKAISWGDLKKQLGDFSLSVSSGELKKNEVSGILGPNGIGKTSFVKLLAGVTKPDTGEMDESVTVSYKPQYLSSESEELVQNLLSDALEKYEALIIRPLEIKPLLQKQVNQLSGGELQKVSIALALSRDANLYLLDEPSAYLDVEQRLVASRVIRDFMEQKGKSCLVVDHDLLFIDYISDSLVIFDGEPAKEGISSGPYTMGDGMNRFLTGLNTTLRRDPENHRPRVNKPGSQMDQKQKREGKLYYS
ncbi:MAG: ribosome biogenesis/translation initiation ATPase RLI [Candidatus Woesearchaeota archaeon]